MVYNTPVTDVAEAERKEFLPSAFLSAVYAQTGPSQGPMLSFIDSSGLPSVLREKIGWTSFVTLTPYNQT